MVLFSKLGGVSKFRSLETFDTPETKPDTSAVRINSFPAFYTVVHSVVALLYNICRAAKLIFTVVHKPDTVQWLYLEASVQLAS